MQEIVKSKWISPYWKTSLRSQLRLFCLPYGGGGAAIFREWHRELPDSIEVCAIQLPGRENRFGEEPFLDVFPLVESLGSNLEVFLDLPCAIFGHSLGALIGFELIRYLRKAYRVIPTWFFASAFPAPHLPRRRPLVSHLPDKEFVATLRNEFDLGQAVVENDALMEMIAPTLRADIGSVERYVYIDDDPLESPITIFGGSYDREAQVEELDAWRIHTRSSFRIQLFPGDHFFIENFRVPLLKSIESDLAGRF